MGIGYTPTEEDGEVTQAALEEYSEYLFSLYEDMIDGTLSVDDLLERSSVVENELGALGLLDNSCR